MSLIHTELSGADFNNIYKDTKFYKFLKNDLKHYDFQYELGLNIDTKPFNPNNTCSEGGLYFCEESKCHMYWMSYGNKLAFIEIPNDARVYIENDKFKADKLVITEVSDFKDVSDGFWISILSKDGNALKYVKEQTYEIYKLAVQQDGYSLEYVEEQTEEICKLAVQQDGYSLEYVREQFKTEEICKLAVQQNGYALQYVKEQTEELCKLAVQQNGNVLYYVKEQTHDICKLAVSHNGLCMC
jgi:flagellar biosynthesis/type III secretory pathway chaperone